MGADRHCQTCGAVLAGSELTCTACVVLRKDGAVPTDVAGGAVPTDVAGGGDAGTASPQAGSYEYPCPECGHPMAIYYQTCTRCGGDLGAGWPPQGGIPPGWIAVALGDGSVQLRRTRFNHLSASGPALGTPLLVAALYAMLYFGTPLGRAPASFVILGVPIAAILAAGAWITSGVEEWLLRPNSLEIRKCLLGREWTKQYVDAELWYRRVNSQGQKRGWQLLLRQGERSYLLHSTNRTEMAMDQALAKTGTMRQVGQLETRLLGSYLSAITGWTFHTSPGQPISDGFTRFGE